MRASLRRWSSDESEDGVSHGWQSSAEAVARRFFFSRLCLDEAAILQEGVGDHRHERVPVQACPGSSLEVVEAEFFLELLMRLLADPARLDGCRQA